MSESSIKGIRADSENLNTISRPYIYNLSSATSSLILRGYYFLTSRGSIRKEYQYCSVIKWLKFLFQHPLCRWINWTMVPISPSVLLRVKNSKTKIIVQSWSLASWTPITPSRFTFLSANVASEFFKHFKNDWLLQKIANYQRYLGESEEPWPPSPHTSTQPEIIHSLS